MGRWRQHSKARSKTYQKHNGIYRKWDQDKIATWWTQQWHRLCGRSWHGFQHNLWKNRRGRRPGHYDWSNTDVVAKKPEFPIHIFQSMVLIFLVFHPYLFAWWMKTNDLVLRNNKTMWELFLIWIASVFPQIMLNFRYIPLCFWHVLLRAFECCLQRPTVIISSRDNLWGKRLFNVMSYGDRKLCLLSFL